MEVMAKKASNDRVGSRHLDRHTMRISDELHRQLSVLAERNHRPLIWEVKLALQQHLEANGLWPPPAEPGA